MRLRTVARYAICAGLLAGALPAPAAAQFGGLKRKLKEKIINAAADGAADKVFGPDSSATSTTAARGPSAASRARGGATATGPVFNENMLEITPDVLDRLLRAVAAEEAERKALAAHPRKVLPRDEYNRCKQQIIMQTPEGQLAFRQYREALQSGSQEAAQKAGQAMTKRLDDLARPRCGSDPIEAQDLRNQDEEKIRQAGLTAFGLGEYQYAMVRERIAPFCAAAKAGDEAVTSGRVSAGATAIYYVYTKREIEGLRPLCGKLQPLLEAKS